MLCSDTVVVFSERIERSQRNDIKSESFPVRVELNHHRKLLTGRWNKSEEDQLLTV